MLPKFSLDRGFEFHHAVGNRERQCFLQSVLMAGLLQRMGAEAGVVMIFKSQLGQTSNLGHAAVVLKLSSGRDVIVDASDPTPFIPHQGVFARVSGYRFLTPVYAMDSPQIVSYRVMSGKFQIAARQLRTFGLRVPALAVLVLPGRACGRRAGVEPPDAGRAAGLGPLSRNRGAEQPMESAGDVHAGAGHDEAGGVDEGAGPAHPRERALFGGRAAAGRTAGGAGRSQAEIQSPRDSPQRIREGGDGAGGGRGVEGRGLRAGRSGFLRSVLRRSEAPRSSAQAPIPHLFYGDEPEAPGLEGVDNGRQDFYGLVRAVVEEDDAPVGDVVEDARL